MILEIRIVCITCMVSHKSGRRPENCRKLGQRTLVSGILEIPRHQTFASGLLPFYPKLLKANFNQVTRTAHSYNAADSAQAKWGNLVTTREDLGEWPDLSVSFRSPQSPKCATS